MSLLTFGLVFLLIGAGFFVSWGNTSANVNVTADLILGAIFSVIGIALVRYHPVEDATRVITNTVNKIMDDSVKKLTPSRDAKESINRIESESQEAMREITKNARVRIHKIASDIGELTADTVE